MSMPDVVDLVEQSRETLDDVWRQTDLEPYPETRMVRLMDVIGETVSHTHLCAHAHTHPHTHKPKPGNEKKYLLMLFLRYSVCQPAYVTKMKEIHVLRNETDFIFLGTPNYTLPVVSTEHSSSVSKCVSSCLFCVEMYKVEPWEDMCRGS